MKKNILIVMVTAVIFTLVGVGAAALFNAKDVSYTPSDSSWNVDNLGDAIDDLYLKSLNYGLGAIKYSGGVIQWANGSSSPAVINVKKGTYIAYLYSGAATGHGTTNSANLPPILTGYSSIETIIERESTVNGLYSVLKLTFDDDATFTMQASNPANVQTWHYDSIILTQ